MIGELLVNSHLVFIAFAFGWGLFMWLVWFAYWFCLDFCLDLGLRLLLIVWCLLNCFGLDLIMLLAEFSGSCIGFRIMLFVVCFVTLLR